MLEVLDAAAVRRWAACALEALGREREHIDALNVFPVPDGDTGTNLYLTVEAAHRSVEALAAGADGVVRSADELADGTVAGAGIEGAGIEGAGFAATMRALAQGAFLGARGNSGVILGQILRGMSDAVVSQPGLRGVDGRLLAIALVRASRAAYAAVGSPVEGTVLTVVRDVADAVSEARSDELAAVTRIALDSAMSSLLRTPDHLAVLREHGVVDAGGAGLVLLLAALHEVVTGVTPTESARLRLPAAHRPVAAPEVVRPNPGGGPAFEVMYLLEADEARLDGLRAALEQLGDSLLVVGGEGLWNVHVHVDDAGAAVEAGLAVGRPYRIRVEPLVVRVEPPVGGPAATGSEQGGTTDDRLRRVVAIVEGDGLADLAAETGAMTVRSAPGAGVATQAVLDAVVSCGTSEVIVIPADRTVRAAAEAAASEARELGLRVAVIPVRAVVQGLAALAVHDPARRFDDDVVAMTTAAGQTRVAEVAVAGQHAITMAGECRPGDVLGLVDGDVVLIGSDVAEVAETLLDRLLAGGGELVTLVRGAGPLATAADAIHDWLHDARPDVECVCHDAGAARDLLLLGVE